IPSSKLDVVGGDVVTSNGAGFFWLNGAGTGMGAGIKSSSAEDLAILTGGQSRVRVDRYGLVSIGDISPPGPPLAAVHIKNSTPLSGTLGLEGDTHVYLRLYYGGTGQGAKGSFGFLSPNTPDLTIGNFAGGRIVLTDSSGTQFPTGGEESLRIVRGSVI